MDRLSTLLSLLSELVKLWQNIAKTRAKKLRK